MAVVALAMLAGVSACGGSVVIDPEPESTGSAGSGGEPTAVCTTYCKARGDRCGDSTDAALCQQTCDQLESPASPCYAEIYALFDCLRKQQFSCGGLPAACDDVVAAYMSCAGGP